MNKTFEQLAGAKCIQEVRLRTRIAGKLAEYGPAKVGQAQFAQAILEQAKLGQG